MARIYEFDTSKGAGVPGLPHIISDEEAKALGVFEILQGAIKNGSYKEKQAATPKPKPAVKKGE